VKFGALRGPDGAWLGFDARPAAVKTFLAYTLRRLGTDYVDVYRLGRSDPSVPIEAEILPTCRELGVGIIAYGVLSRGLLSGHWTPERTLAALDELARSKDASPAQIAIAWVLSRGDDVVPLVGARRRDRLEEALQALELDLSAGDLAAIERAVPPDAVAGERYDAHQMAILDSEQASA
jgi:aryl-alcohol dehydrogenase-like predicted oxidoreductase